MTTIRVRNHYTVQADQNLQFTDEPAFLLASGGKDNSPQLTNFGSVSARSDAAGARLNLIEVDPDATSVTVLNKAGATLSVSCTGSKASVVGIILQQAATIDNDGTFSASSANGAADGIQSDGPFLHLHNDGVFDVESHAYSTAVRASGFADIVNTGEITSKENGFFYSARGLVLEGLATVDNSGEISVQGGGGADAIIFGAGGSELDNSGKIVARERDSESFSTGVTVSAATGQVTIVNSGAIKAYEPNGASIAISESSSSGTSATHVVIDNSGTLLGDVALSGGGDQVTNSGDIQGSIRFGDDGDVLRVTGRGVVEGQVYGNGGDDTLGGGRASDSLHGGDGNDLVTGEAGDDVLAGDTGSDTLVGGKGSDTLIGSGDDDTFVYNSIKDSAPGMGADSISGLGSGDTIDLSAIDADKQAHGDQAFQLVDHFDGHAGQAALIYDADSNTTKLELDVTGDGHAEAVIRLQGDQQGFDGFVL